MDELTQDRLLERFERVCRERGIAMTIQRRVVFEALLACEEHPVVNDVYQQVRKQIPGISQATVYRVLELFEDAGLATRVHHPGSASRYDADPSHHDHLLCLKCQRLVDASAPPLQVPPLTNEQMQGFEVRGYSIVYKGVCPDCQREGNDDSAVGGTLE